MNLSGAMNLPEIHAGLISVKGLYRLVPVFLACLLLILLNGCATAPVSPEHVDNVCEIFRENRQWYRSARKSYEKWGIPIPIMMAIIHQESRFKADARPPRSKCLLIFPGLRPSSAYGYSQAGDATWKQYIQSTANRGADRGDFDDAIDFVGWYCNLSHSICRISKQDTYNLYLAYHEGHGGFNRKTYLKKGWLLKVARKVEKMAQHFKGQLAYCEKEFQRRGPCCILWFF